MTDIIRNDGSSASGENIARRGFLKSLMMLFRRGHLYTGLFFLPWAILYGVTAFLFNHPNVFSDQNVTLFSSTFENGFAHLPAPRQIAENVVRKLNEKQSPSMLYELQGEPKFNRDFAFGTATAEGQSFSFLIDPRNGRGNFRNAAKPNPTPKEVKPIEQAPFSNLAISHTAAGKGERGEKGGQMGGRGNRNGPQDGPKLSAPENAIKIENAPEILIRDGMNKVFAANQIQTTDITLTSVPDVVFTIKAEGKSWLATYNSMTGIISGTNADTPLTSTANVNELGWRRFLLRLHTAHGYPSETNSRWYWAIIVDAMAFVMCFWGITGLVMWWQLKGQRKIGFVILMLSTLCAVWLAYSMYFAIRG